MTENTNLSGELTASTEVMYEQDTSIVVPDYLGPGPINYPILVLLTIAGLFGTFGNVLVIGAILVKKSLQTTCNMFVANLALADIMVAAFVDPFSILAVFTGESWFARRRLFCDVLGAICVISCTASLMNITCVSINRWIHICHPQWYNNLFSKTKTFGICMCVWIFSFLVTSPNMYVGDYTFDRKQQSCLWDRTAVYNYSLSFMLVVVIQPILLTALCYMRIFMFVTASKRRVAAAGGNNKAEIKTRESARLAKTLFTIYIVFVLCWAPYAIVIVGDVYDTWPQEIHIWALVMAHTNSSLNFALYGLTNKQFRQGYIRLLGADKCMKRSEKSLAGTMSTVDTLA